MAFAGILPKIPSFGEKFAQSFSGGLNKGFDSAHDFAQKIMMEKYKKKQRSDLVNEIENGQAGKSATSSSKPMSISEQMKEEFTKSLPEIEQHLGRELEPQETAKFWQQFKSVKEKKEMENQKNSTQQQFNSPTSQDIRMKAKKYAAAGEDSLAKIALEEATQGLKEKNKISAEERQAERSRYAPQLEAVDEAKKTLPRRQAALDLFKRANQEGVGSVSKSNLARIGNDLTGTDIFREDNAGAMLNYAAKTSLIEALDSVKAKGLTLFLEKRLSEAQPNIGSSQQANMSKILPMQAAFDIDKHYLDSVTRIEDSGEKSQSKIIRQAQKETASFAEQRLKQLSIEIQKNIESNKSDAQLMDLGYKGNPKNVDPGTPLTERRATLFLEKYGYKEGGNEKDNEKAIKTATSVAKQLGYDIE